MKVLRVHHTTVYRYAKPVTFGEHRLMFRPRDSHDIRLLDTALLIAPRAEVRWMHDVFGNSVAIASFGEQASELRFESTIDIEHHGGLGPSLPIEQYAETFPFSYSSEDIPDLGRTTERHYSDPSHQIDEWAKTFLKKDGLSSTIDLLRDINFGIKRQFVYQARDAHGTQSPVDTLQRRSGACRDFALLMMEACRSLGFAARFVSGYLYDAVVDGTLGPLGGGATHAWVQVYVPGAGWVEFDPTNGLVGGDNLIRVAVTRDPSQAIPLSGSFTGDPGDFLGMEVRVDVTSRAPGTPTCSTESAGAVPMICGTGRPDAPRAA